MSDALIERLAVWTDSELVSKIRSEQPGHPTHTVGGDCQEAAAEISALREERDRLRAALRGVAIRSNGGLLDRTREWCSVCGSEWLYPYRPERHEAGCLVALGERSGERE